jgi:hypothetical protein
MLRVPKIPSLIPLQGPAILIENVYSFAQFLLSDAKMNALHAGYTFCPSFFEAIVRNYADLRHYCTIRALVQETNKAC